MAIIPGTYRSESAQVAAVAVVRPRVLGPRRLPWLASWGCSGVGFEGLWVGQVAGIMPLRLQALRGRARLARKGKARSRFTPCGWRTEDGSFDLKDTKEDT